ncbi:hypothetical protein [Candidatus Nanohalococcus occultus]|uniref:hypothetical protein n=1 Tax=Candidatus Nanohalococcus occultus TaxID=2978047 RepID=UPI0039E067E8
MKYRILGTAAAVSFLLAAGSFTYSVEQPGWDEQMIANNTYGKFVEIDSYSDSVGIAYIQSKDTGLVFEERSFSTQLPFVGGDADWRRQVIDNRSEVGMYLSVESDDGRPFVAYQDGDLGDEKLLFAQRQGGQWSSTEVDSVGTGGVSVGMYNSLSFLEGRPVILYHSPSQGLKLAERTGGQWDRQSLKEGEGWFTETDTCGGNLLAAYRSRDTEDLRFGQYDGEWNSENTSFRTRSDLDLETGEDCGRHLLYLNASSDTVVYKSPDENKEFANAFFTRMSLEVDEQPHILYHDSGTGIVYSTRTDNRWQNKTLREGEDIGRYNDIEVDPSGNIHTVYTDGSKVFYSVYNVGTVSQKRSALDGIRAVLSALTLALTGLVSWKTNLAARIIEKVRS